MAEVFVCPAGTVSKRSIADLRKAGVVVVEAEAPERCTFVRASEVISSDDLLWAALSAINVTGDSFSGGTGSKQREAFARRLFEILDEAHQARRKGVKSSDVEPKEGPDA